MILLKNIKNINIKMKKIEPTRIYCCGCEKVIDAKLVNGDIIYPNRTDLTDLNFYKCECGLYVGCHKNRFNKFNDLPKQLGCIPTPAIRRWRKQIHRILDPLWKNARTLKRRKNARKKVYDFISNEIKCEYHTANISSTEQAEKIFKIVQSYIKLTNIEANNGIVQVKKRDVEKEVNDAWEQACNMFDDDASTEKLLAITRDILRNQDNFYNDYDDHDICCYLTN